MCRINLPTLYWTLRIKSCFPMIRDFLLFSVQSVAVATQVDVIISSSGHVTPYKPLSLCLFGTCINSSTKYTVSLPNSQTWQPILTANISPWISFPGEMVACREHGTVWGSVKSGPFFFFFFFFLPRSLPIPSCALVCCLWLTSDWGTHIKCFLEKTAASSASSWTPLLSWKQNKVTADTKGF